MANVFFKFGTQAEYDALGEKNDAALYFITDTKRIYKGETLMSSGDEATSLFSGLLGTSNKVALDKMIDLKLQDLSNEDGSITFDEGKIGVAISSNEGNAIKLKDDGLYLSVPENVEEVVSMIGDIPPGSQATNLVDYVAEKISDSMTCGTF